MKAVFLGVVVAITSTLAQAEDMAEMISRYRHAHGLSAVKTDPQLTAIAERQAKAMAALIEATRGHRARIEPTSECFFPQLGRGPSPPPSGAPVGGVFFHAPA